MTCDQTMIQKWELTLLILCSIANCIFLEIDFGAQNCAASRVRDAVGMKLNSSPFWEELTGKSGIPPHLCLIPSDGSSISEHGSTIRFIFNK